DHGPRLLMCLMPLLFLEFIGTTELIVIAAVALLVFGPRKLPEIGRTIGKSLAEFKRASEDFKRTWEYEVDMERSESETRVEPAAAARATLPDGEEAAAAVNPGEGFDNGPAPAATEEPTVARTPKDYSTGPAAEAEEPSVEESSASGGKKDWL
ncbi:MAG TPA: twin-arginine translocase TatA/TatE family subunit, partial [Pyrinomonadaceae bacterium]